MSASFIEANYESFFEKLSVIEFTADIVGNEAKGRTSQWVLHENKGRQIFWKTNISYPLISTRTSAYQRWQIFVFGKFGALCFLVTTVLRFALLLYYRRYYITFLSIYCRICKYKPWVIWLNNTCTEAHVNLIFQICADFSKPSLLTIWT